VSRAGERIRLAGQLAGRNPRALADYARLSIQARRGNEGPHGGAPPRASLTTEQALARLEEAEGSWTDGPALAEVRSFAPAEMSAGVAETARLVESDDSLARLAYAVVRAVRPAAVIETGVATGVTSAHVLAALADNGSGELHSIDLPPRDIFAAGLVGCRVPPALRARWAYHLGASRRLLAPVLARTAARPRLFIHDSDHAYANMRWELERAWEAFRPGDWLLADDVNRHSAFADVADDGRAPALFVAQARPGGVTGMMRKPG
jgi:hypothetical protein